jgi:cell division protein FtsL
MVHNQSLSSSVSASVSAEWTETLQQPLTQDRLRALDRQLILPTTLTGFLWLLAAVLLVCAGMSLLIYTSAQTFALRQQVAVLKQQQRAIERQNAEIVWQIAQHTSLVQIRQRAEALGYQVPTVRHFVIQPTSQPVANAVPAAATSQGIEEAPSSSAARPNLSLWLQQQLSKFSAIGW